MQHINLKVLGQDQSEIGKYVFWKLDIRLVIDTFLAFKIKRTTPLQRLMDAYVGKTGQVWHIVAAQFTQRIRLQFSLAHIYRIRIRSASYTMVKESTDMKHQTR